MRTPAESGPKIARRAALAILLPLLLLIGVPAAASAPRGARECAAALDCTAAEIEAIPMAQRVVFVRAMQDRVAAEYVPGFRHWRNIEGLLRFFAENGYGAPGSWTSLVDSGDLEGIERGTAIALRGGGSDFGNPGARLWADYLHRMHRGELAERREHDPAWSIAEQATTDHGARLAAERGVRPSRVERNFYDFANLYRWMLRNPQPALLALNEAMAEGTGIPLAPVDFLRWFTDVTRSEPTYRGAHVVEDVALPDPVSAPLSALQVLLAYAPELLGDAPAHP